MEIKSKRKLGLNVSNRIYFTDEEKRLIIEDYLSGNGTKKEIYQKYTGYTQEHGKISKWMRSYGIKDRCGKCATFELMPKRKKEVVVEPDEFEVQILKKRIEELEKQLHSSEMKAIAFSTMVDIAEKEFNIPIRKKHNTKPSK